VRKPSDDQGVYANGFPSSLLLMQLVELAEAGNKEAEAALKEYAATLLDQGIALPSTLAAYVQRLLMAPFRDL
jgi:hypothetical protein